MSAKLDLSTVVDKSSRQIGLFCPANSIRSWSCAEHDEFFVKLKQISTDGLRGKTDGSKACDQVMAPMRRPCASAPSAIGVKRDNCQLP